MVGAFHAMIIRLDLAAVSQLIGAIGIHRPGLSMILKVGLQNLPEPPPQGLVLDRGRRLHPVVEIPIHPVRRTNEEISINGIFMSTGEPEDATVLQELPDDRMDPDVLTDAGQARTQTAEASNDAVDPDPCR